LRELNKSLLFNNLILKKMNILNSEEAIMLATQMGPHIGGRILDVTRDPWFPKGRTDIAVVQRDAEDGSSYGRTKWYVAYDNGNGTKIQTLHDSGNIHDNCHTWSVEVISEVLTVKIGYGGYEPTLTLKLSKLGLTE
jgi:hypothetical protein